ncbi:Mbeg1-like protein [Paenibacillus caui]|uniref:Mbeg1-like protein n=1 Tax=Paenibacillus caui TaxID=2873927 RepID=UPI001CA7EE16|nr:Mbeg1-like protein [Paenibacillus caui]
MAELSESQLLLLDNLIYLNEVANKTNETVGDIVGELLDEDAEKLDLSRKDGKYPGQMSRAEWLDILHVINRDPQLKALRITDSNPAEYGMRVATFVDPEGEATVVFRGTSGDFEWYDNGQGGYLPETTQQKAALEYIEKQKYNNITVTGHSKGGNKTQFVAIMSDKVDRAVSFDGQGFSREFLEDDKYKDRIKANAYKITSISAENDYVNCLLNPIAATIKYIDTEDLSPLKFIQKFGDNHKPNIMLDENGQLRGPAQQGEIPKFINEFSIYINENMKEPYRSYAIDGALGWLQTEPDDGFELISLEQKINGSLMIASHLDDFVFNKISKKYGDAAELVVTYIAARFFPLLFMDDYLNSQGKIIRNTFEYSVEKLKQFGDWMVDRLTSVAAKMIQFGIQTYEAFTRFLRIMQAGWNLLKEGAMNFVKDVKDKAVSAVEAVDRFKDKITRSVTDFFQSVAEGTKKFIDVIDQKLHKAVDNVKETASSIVDRAKSAIAEKFKAFRNAFDNIAKGTLDAAGLMTTYTAAILFPELFMDDFVKALLKNKENIHKALIFATDKLEQFGDWMVNHLVAAADKIKQFGNRAAEAMTKFARAVQSGWIKLKGRVTDFAKDVKDGALQAVQAMERFKDKVVSLVNNFFKSVATGAKKFGQGVSKLWNKTVDKVKETARSIVNRTKNGIAKKFESFKTGIELMTKLARKSAEHSLRKTKDKHGNSGYIKKIARGYRSYASGSLAVDYSRLADLRAKVKHLEDDFGSSVRKIISDAQRITSSVGRSYSEPNVQRQIHQIQRACDRVNQYGRRVAEELQRKVNSLKYAEQQYRKIESMLS